MYPEDDRSKKRFFAMIDEMTKVSSYFPESKALSVLDVAAGSGIAGVAISKVLMDFGRKVALTLSDVRDDDFPFAGQWAKVAGIDLKINCQVLDAKNLHELEEKFDIVILWGFSTPHFSPKKLIRVFSSVSKVLKKEGVFLVQEKDRVFEIFYRNDYRSFLPEGNGIVSVDEGYDRGEGCFIRGYYYLESFRPIARSRVRMWDTPLTAAILEIFFSKVEIVDTPVSDIVVAIGPRKLDVF